MSQKFLDTNLLPYMSYKSYARSIPSLGNTGSGKYSKFRYRMLENFEYDKPKASYLPYLNCIDMILGDSHKDLKDVFHKNKEKLYDVYDMSYLSLYLYVDIFKEEVSLQMNLAYFSEHIIEGNSKLKDIFKRENDGSQYILYTKNVTKIDPDLIEYLFDNTVFIPVLWNNYGKYGKGEQFLDESVKFKYIKEYFKSITSQKGKWSLALDEYIKNVQYPPANEVYYFCKVLSSSHYSPDPSTVTFKFRRDLKKSPKKERS